MAVLESHDGYYLWKYLPSIPAAVVFLILFVATTGLHLWRILKTKTWFCIVFAIGGFFEVIGYIGRAIAHNSTGKLIPFILQNFFILLAPALFAASIYMVLGRIIRSVHGEQHSLIRVHWLTRAFVLGDVFSFMIQGGAAGLMVTGNNVALGNNIVIAGLAIQVISFGLFIITAIVFQVRIGKFPTRESVLEENMPWKQNLYGLYAMSVLVLIRSVFRVVEYSLGYDGYALEHEWTLYAFDSVPMFFVTVVFFWRYPSRLRVPPKDGEVGTVELVQIQTVHEGK
ncbi:RTA1 like protein [Stipitochalara longipes BDJ]|nr:RTA1 like protein [Stipitochalara longipes BDJ]